MLKKNDPRLITVEKNRNPEFYIVNIQNGKRFFPNNHSNLKNKIFKKIVSTFNMFQTKPKQKK